VSQEVAVLPEPHLRLKPVFNIPARRKSDTVEYRHIVDEFQRVALAHSNIYFTFIITAVCLPASSLRQRIVNIFSGKTNQNLFQCKKKLK
jgi:DNA mismatch repair protein MutL